MKRAALAALLLPLAVAAQQPKAFDWNDLIGPAADLIAPDADIRRYGKLTAFYSADELYRVGKNQAGWYIVGVIDADAASPQRHYCMPDGVSGMQVRDLVWRHLENNPQDRHHGAPFMVRRALADAWPCPRR